MSQPPHLQNTQLPFSKTRKVNDLLFISGQVGIDPATGKLVSHSFEAEAHQVMQNIGTLLRQEGLDFSDLANVTVYLKNMDHYPLTNQVYGSYFPGPLPARVCVAVADLPAKANIEIAATAQVRSQAKRTNKEIVKAFLEEVRAGKAPEKAHLYLADTVLAHQMNAEHETTVTRTPQNYADHVRDFLSMYGNFTFEITELLADGDKVYARWKQTGKHQTDLDGYAATGKPLVEIASAVYKVKEGKITEYWIQIDRLGFEEQLKQQAKK
ncbi:MAG: Rid family detoxifying hydrolase [Rufibacter sp.]